MNKKLLFIGLFLCVFSFASAAECECSSTKDKIKLYKEENCKESLYPTVIVDWETASLSCEKGGRFGSSHSYQIGNGECIKRYISSCSTLKDYLGLLR